MGDSTILFQDTNFRKLLESTATLLGFKDRETMLTRFDELGILETVDRFLLKDLTRIGEVDSPAGTALLILLFSSLQRGSLCLDTDGTGLDRVLGTLGVKKTGAALSGWTSDAPSTLLCEAPGNTAPLVMDRKNGLLYFQRLYLAEQALMRVLESRLAQPAGPPAATDKIRTIIREIGETRVPEQDGTKIRLNREQKLAVAAGLTQPILLITGGPGTGKTALVAGLLRALLLTGTKPEAVHMAAPTGRAAQRLADAVGAAIDAIPDRTEDDALAAAIGSGTLHRLLSYNPRTGGFRHNRQNPLPYDVLVVDEASMISADLMAALLEAIHPDCRLVLIGDKDQLPSVDAGAVLSDLLPDNPQYSSNFAAWLKTAAGIEVDTGPGGRFRDRTVFLTKSYRSEEDILSFAGDINAGKKGSADGLPTVPLANGLPDWPGRAGETIPEGSCRRMEPPKGTRDLHTLAESWIRERMMQESWEKILGKIRNMELEELKKGPEIRQLFKLLSGARILTCLRRGPLGCESINKALVSTLREEFDPGREGPFFHGLPILITENDRTRNLFNGDIGLVLRCRNDGHPALRVFIDRPAEPPVYAPDEIPAWEPAFAITVHKSQGSEYGEVLLVMPEEPAHNLNTREILYTGVTRGKRLAVILGSSDVIDAAAATPNSRQSGLKIWSREEG